MSKHRMREWSMNEQYLVMNCSDGMTTKHVEQYGSVGEDT